MAVAKPPLPAQLVQTLMQALGVTSPPEAKVWTAIAFLEKHAQAGHMRYAQFRKKGVALGSGAIESAIRRVVNLRLKGPSIYWHKTSAEAVLLLRSYYKAGRWNHLEKQALTTATASAE